ncbi:cytochrome c oxidase subunit II [Psychromonas ossibalaenae]|uniref:cytochrome c oxidase subunit II n=1 Tax=Psychromonas ossibalaenae TaxID=444922 RepID=UPI00035D5E1C|nr:cytochrome c oxidase subunit II [Psychromonas ossibalaenae]
MPVFLCTWLFLLFVSKLHGADSQFNMRHGVTDISENVYQLHMTIFLICCVIALLVFGVMFWAIWHHRQSKGVKPALFHESTKIEILWTAVPFVILIAMAVPATKTLIAMEDTSKADLTVKITASQWKWHYQYLSYDKKALDISFYSILSTPQEQINNQEDKQPTYLLEVDKPLVIPSNKKVRFLMTSDDVIHSWWVPDFAVKKDAVPGFINEAWTKVNDEGVYRGQCAELCGKNHGFMPIVVDVRSPEQFSRWLVEQKALKQNLAQQERALQDSVLAKAELMALGKDVYSANCSVCHQPTGLGLAGGGPAIKGSPIAVGDVGRHIDIVLNGKAGTAMQSFSKQLSAKQLAAVITYERNAWGNNSGDLVQPSQIIEVNKTPQEVIKETGVDKTVTPKVVAETIEINEVNAVEEKPHKEPEPLALLTREQLMVLGKKVYQTNCAVCHQSGGEGMPGAFPALKGSLIATGPVDTHISIVLNGTQATAMMPFKAMLSLEQLAAVITYERNAWGNETGDLVQPLYIDNFIKGEK